MAQHTFITVEGPHDVAFLWRLLKPLGFKKIEVETELEPYWKPLIPDNSANVLVWPSTPNTVSTTTTRTGVLILPDLTTQGSLDDLLLEECANTSYPEMKKLATTYVNHALLNSPVGQELKKALKELQKEPTKKKAIVAAMVALLKSGRNTQNSINDDRWFAPEVFKQTRIRACLDFISHLTGAPIPTDV
jgi:hypothetical protein